ncbi:hypothetical protein OSB04_018995 [Centaurea solstitialis]|uniref:GAG-pre-integrase domain-containing protein n=1 Tax=Centaurea solstitialis TaxID=347529 RepID=A0AA38W4M2_9ASTR|nr:hypothetical protein OSB04_018995 [Centaurea solstitialis]
MTLTCGKSGFVNTDYGMWEVVENEPGTDEDVAEGAPRPPPRSDADRKRRQTEMKARSTLFNKLIEKLATVDVKMDKDDVNRKFLISLGEEWTIYTDDPEDKELEDLYNDLKIFEVEVEAKRKPIGYSHNTALLSSENSNSFNTTASFNNTTANDNISNKNSCASQESNDDTILKAFIASHVKSSLINDDLDQINADDLEEMDIKWQMAMLTLRMKRSIRRTGRNNFDVKRGDKAGFDKLKAEEAIHNQALMAEITETEIPSEVSSKLCSNSCLETVKKYMNHNQAMSDSIRTMERERREYGKIIENLEDQIKAYKANELQFEYDHNYWKWENKEYERQLSKVRDELDRVTKELTTAKDDLEKFSKSSKALESIIRAQVHDDLKRGIGYNNTPPPYNQNYIPPTIDLLDRMDRGELKEGLDRLDPVETRRNLMRKVQLRPSLMRTTFSPMRRVKSSKEKVEKKAVKLVTKWVPKAIVSDTVASKSNGNNCSSVEVNTVASNSSSSNSNTPKVDTTVGPLKRKPIILTKYSSHEIPSKDYLLKLNRLTESNQGRRSSLWRVDSGCSMHMTGIMSLLEDFKRFEGGHVAFGDNPKGGKISGKGFKIDESQVMLSSPRKDNVYCLDIEDASSLSSLNCLFSKASVSESSLWHRRMCHMNFKNMNLLVKNNLVRGKKSYCLVIVHDYSRFTSVYFLRTKDETSGLIKPFVIRMENKTNLRDTVNTACYVQTPYELFEKKKTYIGFLKPFGCPCTILDTKTHLGKFESKSDAMKTLLTYLEVVPNWLFDIDSLTNSLNMSNAVITGSSTEKIQETSHPFVMFPMPIADPIDLCTPDEVESVQQKEDEPVEKNDDQQTEEDSPTDNNEIIL